MEGMESYRSRCWEGEGKWDGMDMGGRGLFGVLRGGRGDRWKSNSEGEVQSWTLACGGLRRQWMLESDPELNNDNLFSWAYSSGCREMDNLFDNGLEIRSGIDLY